MGMLHTHSGTYRTYGETAENHAKIKMAKSWRRFKREAVQNILGQLEENAEEHAHVVAYLGQDKGLIVVRRQASLGEIANDSLELETFMGHKPVVARLSPAQSRAPREAGLAPPQATFAQGGTLAQHEECVSQAAAALGSNVSVVDLGEEVEPEEEAEVDWGVEEEAGLLPRAGGVRER